MIDAGAIGAPPPLGELAGAGPVALFLDFDGTLVEIAPAPDAISVPRALARRLERLSERLGGRLALVSGRSAVDIASHIGAPAIARAGSHGVERLRADGSPIGAEPVPLPGEIEQAVHDFADARPGARFERKSHGAALHFRAAPELEAEAIAFAEELALRHGLWVKLGKCVVELVQPGADKAGAVRAFMAEEPFAGSLPIFVGDDITDEDGFRAAREMGGFGVIVGARTDTLAKYRLASPAKVHEWLEL